MDDALPQVRYARSGDVDIAYTAALPNPPKVTFGEVVAHETNGVRA